MKYVEMETIWDAVREAGMYLPFWGLHTWDDILQLTAKMLFAHPVVEEGETVNDILHRARLPANAQATGKLRGMADELASMALILPESTGLVRTRCSYEPAHLGLRVAFMPEAYGVPCPDWLEDADPGGAWRPYNTHVWKREGNYVTRA